MRAQRPAIAPGGVARTPELVASRERGDANHAPLRFCERSSSTRGRYRSRCALNVQRSRQAAWPERPSWWLAVNAATRITLLSVSANGARPPEEDTGRDARSTSSDRARRRGPNARAGG